MTFHDDMRRLVTTHGAVNNRYLRRFQCGDLSDQEFRTFAIEFYNFARFFPQILASQLVNTEDERVADELTNVLYSELGGGNPRHRHELLYRNFLQSIGIDVHLAMTKPMLPSTRAYIEGMQRLYSDNNHARALGASFGLENMAITMWDHLIPGLTILKTSRYPDMDMTYFTFHRELESTHERAMEQAVAAAEQTAGTSLSAEDRAAFQEGVMAVLNYLEGFWLGLDSRRDEAALEAQCHAA
ncbi:MAG: iron-containing redox enzyme family protein [Nitrospira sp.]|nr:iron-containing redox enzyme family protein [Nitrospira sp.]MCP9442017.1 iron-containing redox enzyme family protein [Nitrospira sp.]